MVDKECGTDPVQQLKSYRAVGRSMQILSKKAGIYGMIAGRQQILKQRAEMI